MTPPITNLFRSCSTSLGSFSSSSVRCLLALAPAALVASAALGQNFGPQQIITTAAEQAVDVYAADLDGDGDADVLTASYWGNKLTWCENLGGGSFGPEQVITTAVDGPWSVHAADLDGDGDADVISASQFDGKIAWYENRLNEVTSDFGPQQVLPKPSGYDAHSVFTSDLDGDGDLDVLAAFYNRIAWFRNDGSGVFGVWEIITTSTQQAQEVYAIDLDGDGDDDVLSASANDDKIAWYENRLNELSITNFGPQQVITTLADGPFGVHAADLDGDGDADVLSASVFDNKIAWYENQGGGVFGAEQVITAAAFGARKVITADLDGDMDDDVLSVNAGDGTIAWYENRLDEVTSDFGPQQVITTLVSNVWGVHAIDLDGDLDIDVLSASAGDDKIAWYENTGPCSITKYCRVADGSIFNTANLNASGCDLNWPITLDLSNGPPKQFTMLLIGSGTATITNPGSSQGDICIVGGFFSRYNLDLGQISLAGTFSTDIFNSASGGPGFGIPNSSGSSILAGETWNFQYWHRNPPVAFGTSGFSEAISVTFK